MATKRDRKGKHVKELNLANCDLPANCPAGINPSGDWSGNHWC